MKIKQIVPSEHEEAVVLAEYLELLQAQSRIELYSHIANETYSRSWTAGKRRRAEGLRKGVPDYVIVLRNDVLFIELKRMAGATSPEQQEWVTKLNASSHDVHAKVCYGANEAIRFIETWL